MQRWLWQLRKSTLCVSIDCACDVKHKVHSLRSRGLPLCRFSPIQFVLLSIPSSFVLHKDPSIDSDLRLTSYYPECRKPTCSPWFCLNSHAWVLFVVRYMFWFFRHPKTFIWVLLVCSKTISLSTYWWWHPTGGNYSPFYSTITVIIRLQWHSLRNSWDE